MLNNYKIDKHIFRRPLTKIFFYNLETFVKLLIKDGLWFKQFSLFMKMLVLLKLRLKKLNKLKLKKSKIYRRYHSKPLLLVVTAIKKVYPRCKFFKLHLSGKKYLVPVSIPVSKQRFIAFKWIIKNAKKRLEVSLVLRLLGEVIETFFGTSETKKFWEEQYILAYENKQFLSYLFRRKKLKKKKILSRNWISTSYPWFVKKNLKQVFSKKKLRYKTLKKLKKSRFKTEEPLWFRNCYKYSWKYKKSEINKKFWINKMEKKNSEAWTKEFNCFENEVI